MADPNQPQQPYPPPSYPPGYSPPGYPPPPQRSGLPGWAIALIVGGVLLVFVCIGVGVVTIGALTLLGNRVSAVFSQIDSDIAEPPPLEETPGDVSGALAIGDKATLPSLRITVTDARPITDPRGATPPTRGNEYWVVEATFENASEDPITLSAFSSSVQDDQEKSYPYSIAGQRASPDPPLPVVTPLQPGKSVSGLLIYSVPQDASELFWIYKDIAGGGQATFKIK